MKTELNDATLDLITAFEGFEEKAYQDSVGVWTIGFGHTAAAGLPKPVKGMTITRANAYKLLAADLVGYALAVDARVRVDITENQRGALVSFTYNLGAANLSKSTLLKKLNAGDYKGAANEFLKWNKAGGKVLKGLTRRREAERALFLS